MAMRPTAGLQAAITGCLRAHGIKRVVESGAYLGLGSTRMLAGALVEVWGVEAPGLSLTTIEGNPSHWFQAQKNLAAWPFVEVVLGPVLARAEMEVALASHPMLANPADPAWATVWVDNLDSPMAFYRQEISGCLGSGSSAPALRDELEAAVADIGHFGSPLICLDGCGGLGLAEFQITRDMLSGHPHAILLDDTHHLKHWISAKELRGDVSVEMLWDDVEGGAMLVWVAA